MRVVITLIALLFTIRPSAQGGDGYPVKVHVLNSITGSPIAGANVVLSTAGDEQISGRSDAGGVFSGRVSSTGKHLITASRKGYEMTGGGGLGNTIDISPGSEIETTVQMLQLGVLAGRVLDQFGDPIRNAIVRAVDRVEPPGADGFYEGFSAATTDDRGEYRIV